MAITVASATSTQPPHPENIPPLDPAKTRYSPTVLATEDGATIQHDIRGAGSLRKLIHADAARWAAEMRCPRTLFSSTQTSASDRQRVMWHGREWLGAMEITPGLVATRRCTLSGKGLRRGSRRDGDIAVPAGLWLIRGGTSQVETLVESLLRVVRDATLAEGRMRVRPRRRNGQLRFEVRVAPDIHRSAIDGRPIQTVALVSVCSQLPRCLDESLPQDRALKKRIVARLTQAGVPLWDSLGGGYEPAWAASALQPLFALPRPRPGVAWQVGRGGVGVDQALLDQVQDAYIRWQRGIIVEQKRLRKMGPAQAKRARERIRRRQRELRRAVDAGAADLGSYLRSALGLGHDLTFRVLPLPGGVTAAQYRYPSLALEEEVGRLWRDRVHANLACRPVFWMLCHIQWIEEGCLGWGGPELARALCEGRPATLEGHTRNFLRRTGGIFVRGNVSVYSDCTMARAWWRDRFAGRVARATAGSAEALSCREAHIALHHDRSAWEELVLASLRRHTVINQERARAQVVRYLHRLLQQGERINSSHVKEAVARLAHHGKQRSLQLTPWEELARIMP